MWYFVPFKAMYVHSVVVWEITRLLGGVVVVVVCRVVWCGVDNLRVGWLGCG